MDWPAREFEMTLGEREAIEKFLDALQLTWRGRAMVVNMLDSVRLLPVDLRWLKEFLLECAETLELHAGSATAPAWSVVEDVAQGHGTRRTVHLRHCRQKDFLQDDAHELANSISTRSFEKHMLNKAYKDADDAVRAVLPRNLKDTPDSIAAYRKALSEVMSEPDWRRPDAVIGMPLSEPSNCWISSNQFGELPDGPIYERDSATRARDELGLSHVAKGTFLVRLSFSASDMSATKFDENARPIFCDLGNARFRVHDPSALAATYASRGWGATLHLGKFALKQHDNMTGRSERVFNALPLSELTTLKVELLGSVGETPGRPSDCKEDDEEFFRVILHDRTESEIEERLTKLLNDLTSCTPSAN